jgi:hypothetical protein
MTVLRFLLLAAVIAWAPGSARSAEIEFKGKAYDYCAVYDQEKTKTTTLFLVDRTAAYRQEDWDRLMRGIAVMEKASTIHTPGTRLEVRTIADIKQRSITLFSGCVPACPKEFAVYDSCTPGAVNADMRAFWKALKGALNFEALSSSDNNKLESAIAETIELAVRETKPATVVVFSDFLEQHKSGGGLPEVSFYSQPAATLLKYLDSLQKSEYLPKFAKTRIIAYGLREEIGGQSNLSRGPLKSGQWDAVERFWVRYFSVAGAAGFHLAKEYPGATMPKDDGPKLPPDRKF